MNITKIEWCDYTWNPITGCLNGCPYCYARKIAMRFTGHFNPTFHPGRLGEPAKVKKPSIIFADSMSDFWGPGVEQDWRNKVLAAMRDAPQHIFVILTKCPQNIVEDIFPDNLWVGVSVENQENDKRIFELWKKPGIHHLLVSFEPLQGEIDTNLMDFDWVIIGGQTNPIITPKKEWVEKLIRLADENHVSVFLKDNLKWPKKIQWRPHPMIRKWAETKKEGTEA